VQLVRTPACHVGGRGFEPRRPRHLKKNQKGKSSVTLSLFHSLRSHTHALIFGVSCFSLRFRRTPIMTPPMPAKKQRRNRSVAIKATERNGPESMVNTAS